METFITSDLHVGHTNIIRYCLRGYGTRAERLAELAQYNGNHDELVQKSKFLFPTAEEMNEILIDRWNSRITNNDIAYIVGDFGMGDRNLWKQFLKRLNGKEIHLILGNHDCNKFDQESSEAKKEIYDCGFTSVSHELYVEIDGKRIWMAHIPRSKAPDKRGYSRPKNKQQFDISLCGHVHDKFVINDFGDINVGVDNWEYYPQTLQELIDGSKSAVVFDSSKFLPV